MKGRNLGVTISIIVGILTASTFSFGTESDVQLRDVSASSSKGTTLYVGGGGPNNYRGL